MSILLNDVLKYGHGLSQEECAQLARRFREYSQVSPEFRKCWDYFNTLDNDQKKFALKTMEASLTILAKFISK